MLLLTSITLASCNGDKTEKFIVKFENTEYKDKKIEKGSILEKPENPSKEGYEFVGWFSDETYTKRFDFEIEIWFLLTIITLGIYGFWLSIKMRQWVVKHTHFQD